MKKLNEVLYFVDNKLSGKNYKTNPLFEYGKEEILEIFRRFSKQIFPIYGYQKGSFTKLIEGIDRKTFILEVDKRKVGILAFKKDLQLEDTILEGGNGYVEIKSFFLFDGFGEGNIWCLWREFIFILTQDYGRADGVYVTISKTGASASLNMFKKIGFKELYDVYNEYGDNDSYETHLYFPLSRELITKYLKWSLMKESFEEVKSGAVFIEGKIGLNYKDYKVGDLVEFSYKNDKIVREIKRIRRYSCLDDFCVNESKIWEASRVKQVCNGLGDYKAQIILCGVLAFEF